MKNDLALLLAPIFLLAGCSSNDDAASQNQSADNPAETSRETTAPKKTNKDNVFSTQIDALDTAKEVGNFAQEAADKRQKALDGGSN